MEDWWVCWCLQAWRRHWHGGRRMPKPAAPRAAHPHSLVRDHRSRCDTWCGSDHKLCLFSSFGLQYWLYLARTPKLHQTYDLHTLFPLFSSLTLLFTALVSPFFHPNFLPNYFFPISPRPATSAPKSGISNTVPLCNITYFQHLSLM